MKFKKKGEINGMTDREFVLSIYPNAFIMKEKGGNIYSCYNKVALGIQLITSRFHLTHRGAWKDAADKLRNKIEMKLSG